MHVPYSPITHSLHQSNKSKSIKVEKPTVLGSKGMVTH